MDSLGRSPGPGIAVRWNPSAQKRRVAASSPKTSPFIPSVYFTFTSSSGGMTQLNLGERPPVLRSAKSQVTVSPRANAPRRTARFSDPLPGYQWAPRLASGEEGQPRFLGQLRPHRRLSREGARELRPPRSAQRTVPLDSAQALKMQESVHQMHANVRGSMIHRAQFPDSRALIWLTMDCYALVALRRLASAATITTSSAGSTGLGMCI